MKRTVCSALLVTSLITLLALPSAAKDKPILSAWASTLPRIDGVADDWADAVRSVDKGTKVEYALRNDAQNLYVLFVFKDPRFLSSVEATGITFYSSTEDKKDKDRGLRFARKMVSADQLIASMEKQGQALTEEKKTEIRAYKTYALFETDIVDKDGAVVTSAAVAGQASPPAFRVGTVEKEVVYEFRIPLVRTESQPAGVGAEPGKILKVGFEWGGMTKEMKQARASQLGGEGVQATGTDSSMEDDFGNVGDGDERIGGSSSSLLAMRRGPKKHSFWVDITLGTAR